MQFHKITIPLPCSPLLISPCLTCCNVVVGALIAVVACHLLETQMEFAFANNFARCVGQVCTSERKYVQGGIPCPFREASPFPPLACQIQFTQNTRNSTPSAKATRLTDWFRHAALPRLQLPPSLIPHCCLRSPGHNEMSQHRSAAALSLHLSVCLGNFLAEISPVVVVVDVDISSGSLTYLYCIQSMNFCSKVRVKPVRRERRGGVGDTQSRLLPLKGK